MTEERLAEAWQCLCDGSVADAERLFRDLLRDQPEHAAAWRLLGEACLRQSKLGEAAEAYREALRRVELQPEDLNNLGVSLVGMGKFEEAEEVYRKVLAARPGNAACLQNLAIALAKQEKYEDAASTYRKAMEANPSDSHSFDGHAEALIKAGRADELIRFLESLADGRFGQELVEHAWGLAHAAKRRWQEAVACHERALKIRPGYTDASCDLSKGLLELDQREAAETCVREGLALNPRSPGLWNNLGCVHLRCGRTHDALSSFESALTLWPGFTECRVNRGHALLKLGDYERGWADYESRWEGTDLVRRTNRPLWDGRALPDGTIVLVAEQGLGDTIQFIRFAPLVKERVREVIVACQEPLIPLLRSSAGIDLILPLGEHPPEFDVYAPLMSLPRILGTTLESVPASVPYLHARPDLIERWRCELRGLGRFLVGVAWQGSRDYGFDRLRSFRLVELEPLARLDDVTLISLQKGEGAEQVAQLDGRFPIVDLGDRIDRDTGAFLDTAAILENLDLVIACDSAVAHLAGSLGVPVWIPLSFCSDWRWLMDRERSPWYPSTRLFRQTVQGAWEGVFSRMRAELEELLSTLPRVSSVPIEIAPGELLDRITILEIKRERIGDPAKLRNVHRELDQLAGTRERLLPRSPGLDPLIVELLAVNEAIWEVEDELRECERRGEFSARFVELARSVYRNNDRRAAIKRTINELLGSSIIEEKGYRAYDRKRSSAA